MGNGTCAVLWQTKRNVVSAQVRDGKGRRGDLLFCSLSSEDTYSGRTSAQRGVRFMPMGRQERATTSPSQHRQRQQNMLLTGSGKREAGKSFGRTKVGHGESGCFSHNWAYVSSRPLIYTKQPCFEHGPRQSLSIFMERRTGRAGLGQKWSASACGREFGQLKEITS